MDLKTFATAFGLIFLAELGDKTQLATLGLAAEGRSRLAVFAGAAAALVLTSLLAVVLGGVLDRYLPRRAIRVGAGALFVAMGVLLIVRA